jgi:peptidoglycan L-alanyl-D-glutamate endopeptidase CwlK
MSIQLEQPSLDMINQLYPGVRERVIPFLTEVVNQTGFNVRITSSFRSINEQQIDYNKGRTTSDAIVTYSNPFQSFHNYGLAFDICFRGKDPYLAATTGGNSIWSRVGALGQMFGFQWGGNFKFPDQPHFEDSYKLNWENCQSLVEDNGLSALWNFIDKQRGIPVGINYGKIPALYSN